jgi:hypothetical protein
MPDGFGTTANGALTAIGLNQNVLVCPPDTKRGLIAHFSITDADHEAVAAG